MSLSLHNILVPSTVAKLINPFHASKLLDKFKENAGKEGYSMLFDLELRDDYKEYKGASRPSLGWVVLDFDDKFDLEKPRADAARLYKDLKLNESNARIFFSGAKGFHIYVREEFFILPKDQTVVSALKSITAELKSIYPTIDLSIMQANRKIRAPDSKHPKTGLYKTQLTFTQLDEWHVEHIQNHASVVRGFDLNLTEESGTFEFNYMTFYKSFMQSDIPKTSSYEPTFGMENLIHETYEPNTIDLPREKCAFLKWNFEHPEQVDQPNWYKAIGIVAWLKDGLELCHTMSKGHPDYQGSEVFFKYNQVRKLTGPTTCATIASGGFDGCRTCTVKCKTPAAIRESKQSVGERNQALLVDAVNKRKQLKGDDDGRPTHLQVAHSVISNYPNKLIMESDTLFMWAGTHWKELGENEEKDLKNRLIATNGAKTKASEAEALFDLLKLRVDGNQTGKPLFQPNPFAANFQNGTLYCKRTAGGEFDLEFIPSHNQSDMLTQCIGTNYRSTPTTSNERFDRFISAIIGGDPEYADKLRALKQCAGAMLMPAFPRIFFLLGEPGSGKSTFAKLFFQLLGGTEFFSLVQPVEMYGFLVETMLHKTVNMHTDVSEKHTVPDSFLKSNEDRLPKLINRKGRKAVEATTPAVHLFCANTLPPTESKNPRVYNRRVTIIKMDRDLTSSGVYERDYEQLILEGGREAVLAFALEGLRDLISSSGLYCQPASGKEMTSDWQSMAMDPFDDFIDELLKNELSYLTVTGLESNYVENQMFYDAFGHWSQTSGHFKNPITKQTFFKRLNILDKSGRLPSLKMGRTNKARTVCGVVLDQSIFLKDDNTAF